MTEIGSHCDEELVFDDIDSLCDDISIVNSIDVGDGISIVNSIDDDDEMEDAAEEEFHDLVDCVKCHEKTHYSVGECAKCGEPFKISKTGYILTGEDGAFICDEEDEDVMDDDDEGSEGSYPSEDEDEMSGGSSADEDEDIVLAYDDEEEYVYKKDDVVCNAPKRITRAAARAAAKAMPI
jgi:hypothetical protein